MEADERAARPDPADGALQAVLRRNLKYYRRLQRRKQADVAQDAGYADHSVLSKFETGRRRIPLERVPALARALRVPVLFLYWEEDPPPPPGWRVPRFARA